MNFTVIKHVMTYLAMSVAIIVSHAVLDHQYHTMCRLNLVNIMFNGNSSICQLLAGILNKTEFITKTLINSYVIPQIKI